MSGRIEAHFILEVPEDELDEAASYLLDKLTQAGDELGDSFALYVSDISRKRWKKLWKKLRP